MDKRAVAASVIAIGLMVLMGIMAGCGSAESEDAEEAEAPRIAESGTAEMVRVLDAINERAEANPMDYFYKNQSRAEYLEQQMEQAPEEEQVGLRFARAHELLNAGQTETSIEQLEAVISEIGASPQTMNQNTRPIFELLGIAYMRLGEEINCIENHSAEACILPLVDEAQHEDELGSQRAAALFTQILRDDRTDLQAQWLLNVAYITLGDYPDEVPSRWRIDGLQGEGGDRRIPRFQNVAPGLGIDHDKIAGGVSVEDFNNNGYLDILVTSYGLDHQMRLYLNDGEGGFEDATEKAGLNGIVGGLNTVHADYTNNGYADVLILRGAWLGEQGRHPNSLLRNNGDGTFTDVTKEAGLDAYHPSQVGAWGDFTNNGYVDLFVGNESEASIDFMTGQARDDETPDHPSRLYRNNGDGTFTDVTEEVGIDVNAYVKGATWGDINNNGKLDLFVSVMGGPNQLYVNQGGDSVEEWQFEEQAATAGVDEPTYSFATWFWDYNNSGHEDLFVAGYDLNHLDRVAFDIAADRLGADVDAERARLFRNNGDGTFTDVTEAKGLDDVMYPMGANFGDLTNNGYLDFYLGTGAPDLSSIVPNRMFYNDGGEQFEEVTFDGGFGHIQKGHGIAFADFNHNGQQDIYAVMGGAVEGDNFQNALFANPGNYNSWITVELEGQSANRGAIGARVEVVTVDAEGNEHSYHRTVTTGGSFGATTLRQNIGLGSARHIEQLTVQWPNEDQTTQTFTDLDVNQHLKIVEGEQPAPLDRPVLTFSSDDASDHHHETDVAH